MVSLGSVNSGSMAALGLGNPLLPEVRGSVQQTPWGECSVSVQQARASAKSRTSKGQRRSGAAGIVRPPDGALGAPLAVKRGGSRNWKQPYDAVDNEILSVLGGLASPELLPTPGKQEGGADSADDGGPGSISQLAQRLADLLSDSPAPGGLPEEDRPRADAAPRSSSPSPEPGRDSASQAGADSSPPLPAAAQTPSGDPLGKKVLGKAAVQWLAQGAALLAADVVTREAAGEEGLPGVRNCGDLIQTAQQYMRRSGPSACSTQGSTTLSKPAPLPHSATLSKRMRPL